MVSAGIQEFPSIHEYVSNLVGTPPTFQGAAGRTDCTGELSVESECPEWLTLYYRDKAYAAFVDDLFSLYHEEDETPPCEGVIDWVLESTVLAKSLLAQNWTGPRVTSDDEGGIRLSWREGDRELRAIVPADLSQRYLYWQHGTKYGGIPNFGSATLYLGLSGMNERVR
jgi:hypothetical protein